MLIDCIDDFLNESEYVSVLQYCVKAPYTYGETDNADTPPTGMISPIEENNLIYRIFEDKIKEKISLVSDLKIYRMYINCFSPGENPYYHIDGKNGITCLYYVNPDFDVNDGGETQFIIDKKQGMNIFPVPNRMCFFDANITHRATSFRNIHRFTIAIKLR